MLIQVPDTQIKYLKNLCECFNQMSAWVHEGVMITVSKDGGAEDHEACEALFNFVDRCVYPETMGMLSDMLSDIRDQLDDVPLRQFYNLFNNARCTCSGNPVTSYEMDQHLGDAPVEGFFEAWDSMVRAIKDRDREAVLYLGYKLHSLINTMDISIYDYKHGTWIDDYINWYLEEVR